MIYPELIVPKEIQAVVERGGYGDIAEASTEQPTKMLEIKEMVTQVENTESALQVGFWTLRNMFKAQSLSS
jgi:hypothetical protein